MPLLRRTASRSRLLLLLALAAFHAPVRGQETAPEEPRATGAGEQEPGVPEPDAKQPLALPDTPEAALASLRGLEDRLEGRSAAELRALLEAWLGAARSRAEAVEAAEAAPEGTPEHEAAVALRAELDGLVSGAETIAEALAGAGEDVRAVRAELTELRGADDVAVVESTVPANRAQALELSVDVLSAQLRPLTRDQVEGQLEEWLRLLQRTSFEVRNLEVSVLRAEDTGEVKSLSERAVMLRADRAALIKRVKVVITALERKGGDVEEARAYVDSVVVNPPIAGWRAAMATAQAWLTDKDGGLAMAKAVGLALGILAAFFVLARLLTRLTRRITRSLPRTSELLREFLVSTVRRLTLLVGVLIALSTLGINMTPLVAAIGAAGLVVGLALQGTLSNLASGLLIMVYRPFDVGDVVEVSGTTGKVDGMTLMTTSVRTFDNQTIHVPNNKIWGDVIRNVTQNETRRVDMVFGIGYDDDVERAKELLLGIVNEHPKVLAEPAPNIRLHELGDSSVNIIVRPWTRTADYWDVYWDVTEAVKRTLDAEGITIPFPQRDVHLIQESPAQAERAGADPETDEPDAGNSPRDELPRPRPAQTR